MYRAVPNVQSCVLAAAALGLILPCGPLLHVIPLSLPHLLSNDTSTNSACLKNILCIPQTRINAHGCVPLCTIQVEVETNEVLLHIWSITLILMELKEAVNYNMDTSHTSLTSSTEDLYNRHSFKVQSQD